MRHNFEIEGYRHLKHSEIKSGMEVMIHGIIEDADYEGVVVREPYLYADRRADLEMIDIKTASGEVQSVWIARQHFVYGMMPVCFIYTKL